jgi:Heterokaryon incompatibility protein (HET)
MHDDSIRLLVLEPAATVEAELKATLSLVRLHNKPTYEAISYAWGPPVFPERIQLVNGRLKITESLSGALLRFRLRDGRRSLWADSVCNQEDKKEQNHQVKIMAMIYKGAESVLSWLGKETPKTRPAREFIESVSESYGYSALKQPIDKHWWMTPPTLKSNIKGADKILKNARDCSIQDWYGRESFTRLWTRARSDTCPASHSPVRLTAFGLGQIRVRNDVLDGNLEHSWDGSE